MIAGWENVEVGILKVSGLSEATNQALRFRCTTTLGNLYSAILGETDILENFSHAEQAEISLAWIAFWGDTTPRRGA